MAEGRGTTDYDTFVDWEKRLAREAPFFRTLFDEAGVRRVADAGCGSGRHAVLFASWGLEVVGVDPSPEMLAAARLAARALPPTARIGFHEGGFGDVARIAGAPVDAVVCLGNALPHVDGRPGLRAALEDFAAALRPGGVVVLHLLNHQRLLDQRVRTIAPVVRDTAEGERVFLRVMDYPGGVIEFSFLTLSRERGGEWMLEARSSPHTEMPVSVLVDELERAGLGRIDVFGGHDGRLLDPERDESVVLTARRT